MRINKSNWKEFLKNVGIRAVKTFFQTFVAVVGTCFVISDVDWKVVASASALSAILSIATSFATGLPEVTPILEKEEDNGEV